MEQPQISQLLMQWSGGDTAALNELMPIVYEELRKLGQSSLRGRQELNLIRPTVLVHEAWMKLASREQLELSHRAQFYALAAKVMRDILVDYFRRQHAAKRGGGSIELQLDKGQDVSAQKPITDLLVLDEALNRLGEIKSRYAKIVELKFFAGLTIEEISEALRVSHATIEREWNFARAWLRRELDS